MAITFGPAYNYKYSPSYPWLVILDSTHFVVLYISADRYTLYGQVGTIDTNGTISFGNEYSVSITRVYSDIRADALDSTHFVVVWDSGDSYSRYQYAIIGTVSGNTITWGSDYTIENSNILKPCRVSALDSTHFVAVYGKYVKVGTVSGSSISFGSRYQYSANCDSYSEAVDKLDSTHFVIAYRDGGNSNYGTAIIGEVSNGNQITFGTSSVFLNSYPSYYYMSALDSTHFVVVYSYYLNTYYGYARVGIVSGTTISWGSAYQWYHGSSDYARIGTSDSLDSTHFVFSHNNGTGTGGHKYVKEGTVSGTTISFGNNNYYGTDNGGYKSCVGSLDNHHFMVQYYYNSYGYVKEGIKSIVYTISLSNGSYVLAGESISLLKFLKMLLNSGSYVFSGFDIVLRRIKEIICETGFYSLTGKTLSIIKYLKVLLESGIYKLSGVSTKLSLFFRILLETGKYVFTFMGFGLKGWLSPAKNQSNWNLLSKNQSNWDFQDKSN